MSRENVKKFYELAEKDIDLAQKLVSLDNETALEASDLANLKDIVNEKIIPLAKEKGLEFTAEEMVEFANEKYIQLSEDDLLEVSGGVSPKAAGLALSSILLVSLGSAAAINLINNNHDNVSHVISDSAPSKSKSESKLELEDEDEEDLKKSLDEMLKKAPKGADKNANMEDIEKELDKLFKGGKLGGGSAFRPGRGRSAGKNMLNRTIGKKGTSDFDLDKFLKELDDELSREAAASQAAKSKASNSEVSDFDFDNFMAEINHKATPETTHTSAPDDAPIEEATKPAPVSKGTSEKVTLKNRSTTPEQQRSLEEALGLHPASEMKQSALITSSKTISKAPKTTTQTKTNVSEHKTQEELQQVADTLAKEHVEDVLKQAVTVNEQLGKEKASADKVIEALKDGLEQDEALKDKLEIENDVVTISVKGEVAGQHEESTVTKTIDLLESYNEIVDSSTTNEEAPQVVAGAVGDQERIEQEKKEAEENARKEAEEKQRIEHERKETDENLSPEDKSSYESVNRSSSWKDVMAHVMDTLLNVDFNLGNLNAVEQVKLKNDIDWVCDNMKQANGTYYLGASAFLGGAIRSNYGWNTKKPTLENKELEFLQTLKASNYNQDDAKVQTALKALFDEEIKEETVKKPDASGEEQEFIEQEAEEKARKEEEARKQKEAEENAKKDKEEKERKQREEAERIAHEKAEEERKQKEEQERVAAEKAAEEERLRKEEEQRIERETKEKVDNAVARVESLIKDAFADKNFKTKLSDEEIKQFVNEFGSQYGTVKDGFLQFVVQDQRKDGTPIEANATINLLKVVNELNVKLPEAKAPKEKLVEKPVEKPDAKANFTTAKELQQQADTKVTLVKTELNKKFNEKIKANNGIELNEAALNEFISETLNSYKGQENLTVNEKNGTVTFTAKGVTKGWIFTGDDSRSATLNVREFFTQLNNDTTEEARESEREKFDHTKYVTATEADVNGGLKFARETAGKMILDEFNKIIVEKYNAENPTEKANSVKDIPANKMASILSSLELDDVVDKIVKANIERTHDFKDPDKEKYEGSYFIKTAAANEEIRIGAIGYKKTGLFGTSTELIKYSDEISIREEAAKLIKENVENNLIDTFNAKIKANNGIELNEAALNEFISETLNSYKGKENITVDEENGTIAFTATGVRSDTLNVRESFTKLNNETTETRRKSERENFDHTKYVTATEADVKGGVKVARKKAKQMLRDEFNKIIVEKYNAENPDNPVTEISKISAGKVASIALSLKEDNVVDKIVEANIERTNDFKDSGSEKYKGSYSIKTAPENKELKIGAIGYKLTGVYGFRQPELIKYGDEISIRDEVNNFKQEFIVSYETVVGGIFSKANTEVDALFKFLEDNNLAENGSVVSGVLDRIKDSDREQFKNDVKQIADRISGSEGNYSLSGKILSGKYSVAQEKLKAIKDLEKQLGV